MVDSVVSFLVGNLSQLLAGEARLLYGVEDSVRSLHRELQMIEAYLRTSEGKKSKKEIEQVLVNQIRDVAYEAEDVIDKFVTNVTMHKRRSMLGRMLHAVDHIKLRHDVAQKIDSIKATTVEMHNNMERYHSFDQEGEPSSTREEEERVQLLHKLRRNVEEDDVVGFDRDSKEVIKRLMKKDSRSNVVSIIGMGGLGKTTLARKVYNSNEVKEYFECRAWVYVSNECRVKELLLGLVKCLMPNPEYERRSRRKGKKQKGIEEPQEISSMSEHELKQKVQECLKRKKYLIVLDDLWKTEDWDEVKDAFPDDKMDSKILITSRLKQVASHTSKDPPYFLQLLNVEESWKLFSKRVFRGEECPSDLEHLGKQIAKSCRGLPLSIIVLAGLLAYKEKSYKEWSKVVGHVNSYLTPDETQVSDIVLRLSYDNLPRRLKPCFLYLGIFPEDSEISVRQLLQRWVAEGFIQQTGTRCLEDVAEDYLYELIDRSLVQAAKVKSGSRGVKTCRIHDLLRDLCISKSKEGKAFEVCTCDNILTGTKPRRLSVHCSMPHYVSSSINDHSCVRSLLCFDSNDHYLTRNEWKWLFKCFKLVRVLDLGNSEIKKIPSNLGLFVHLRYLRINSVYSRVVVPSSICTLQNLQTLELTGRYETEISFAGGLWKLKQLRHVYTHGVGYLMLCGRNWSVSDNEVMWNLQTISNIELNRQALYLFEKGSFPKLRKLGLAIYRKGKDKLRKILPSLGQLSHLNKLKLFLKFSKKDLNHGLPMSNASMESHFGCKPNELLQSLQKLPHLSTLIIHPVLDLLRCGVAAFPPCLTKLALHGVRCISDDEMNALGGLTQLQILRLSGSFKFKNGISHCSLGRTTQLNCAVGGFPQLQKFEIIYLNIRGFRLANGAMPHLHSLVIHHCNILGIPPNELCSLTAIRQVRVWKPNEELSLALSNLEMKGGCELTIQD